MPNYSRFSPCKGREVLSLRNISIASSYRLLRTTEVGGSNCQTWTARDGSAHGMKSIGSGRYMCSPTLTAPHQEDAKSWGSLSPKPLQATTSHSRLGFLVPGLQRYRYSSTLLFFHDQKPFNFNLFPPFPFSSASPPRCVPAYQFLSSPIS